MDWDRHSITKHKGNGAMASCTPTDWSPWKYFLGVIHKKDYFKIGGMDEKFMDGIAWEDRDFALRAERHLKCAFNGKIAGLHISHTRNYQDDNPNLRMVNRRLYFRNRDMYLGKVMYG
jgi:hypothetical protein